MNDWEILDVDPSTATVEILKKSFRKAAFAYHPDLGGDQLKFIAAKAAYERLLGIIDPTLVPNSDKIISDLIKEMSQRYFDSFPWRGNGINLLAENVSWSRESVNRNKRLMTYLEDLAMKQLAEMQKPKLDSKNKLTTIS